MVYRLFVLIVHMFTLSLGYLHYYPDVVVQQVLVPSNYPAVGAQAYNPLPQSCDQHAVSQTRHLSQGFQLSKFAERMHYSSY